MSAPAADEIRRGGPPESRPASRPSGQGGAAIIPAAPPESSGGSWVELYVERLHAAKAHLEGCGFVVQREDSAAFIPSWRVSGYTGSFANDDLLALARHYGFVEAR